jgi:hypothetical protein
MEKLLDILRNLPECGEKLKEQKKPVENPTDHWFVPEIMGKGMIIAMKITEIENVCLDCPDRRLGCHADCMRYLAARSAYDRKMDMIRSAREHEKSVLDYTITGGRKRSKNKKFSRSYGGRSL